MAAAAFAGAGEAACGIAGELSELVPDDPGGAAGRVLSFGGAELRELFV